MRSKLAFTSFPFLKFGRCHFWSFSVQVKDKNNFLCVAKSSNCRSITITWQQRPHFPTAHSQKPFLGTLSMNKTVAVRVTSEEKLFNMLGLTNNWLPFLKTSMVFIRLGENIRWALRNCPIIPCRLLDWYVLITSFEVLRKREVLHFHPAVGGGISFLNRAVVKLYFTEMFFILLLSKAGSSLNGSNLCNKIIYQTKLKFSMTFKNWQVKSMTNQAWKMEFLNSMTFQVPFPVRTVFPVGGLMRASCIDSKL